jgi:hypothetical protein
MAAEEAKKVEVEATKEPEPATATEPVAEAPKEDVAEEKAVIPSPEPPVDNSKALVVVESEHSATFSICLFPPVTGHRMQKVVMCTLRILGIGTKFSAL